MVEPPILGASYNQVTIPSTVRIPSLSLLDHTIHEKQNKVVVGGRLPRKLGMDV